MPSSWARDPELTVPGLLHDVCSAIHPFGVGSPFLSSLPLADHGLVWCRPEIDVAHPLDDGTAGCLRSAGRAVRRARRRRTGTDRARAVAPGDAPAVRAAGRAARERPGPANANDVRV